MVDVGFIDRVRRRIGIHDVLKGGVIKGEGFTVLAGRKMGPGDLLGVGLPGVGEEVGFLGVMVETLGGLLRLVVWTW